MGTPGADRQREPGARVGHLAGVSPAGSRRPHLLARNGSSESRTDVLRHAGRRVTRPAREVAAHHGLTVPMG